MATMAPACIDKEINKGLTLVSNLPTQNDSSLPVFRLPPDTLADIFTHGARNYYYESTDLPTSRVPDWVNVSYVCRHWRNVALDCPALWTYHFTVSLRWTEELLARSKHAPLKIRIRYDIQSRVVSWWMDLLGKLLSHGERIQVLHLRVPTWVIPSNLSVCAPPLQVLDVDRPWADPFYGDSIMDGGDSSLRTLKLVDYPFPWYSLNVSGVTELFLYGVPPGFQQTAKEFLATLNGMQALIHLHLEHALASARAFLSSGTFELSPKINLPCLARLSVIAPLSTVVALLSCASIPLNTKLRLQFECEDGSSVVDYAQIPSLVARLFDPSKNMSSFSPTMRSLGICCELPSTFTLLVSEENDCNPLLSMNSLRWDYDLHLVIIVGMGEMMTSIIGDHILADICRSIPSTDVQTLRVFEPPQSPDFWRKMLGRLHGLRCLGLIDGHMPDLAPLLALAADNALETLRGYTVTDDRHATAGHIFVPALEELNLCGIMFADEDGVSEASLLDALASRKLLPRLVITDFQADGFDMEDDDS